MKKHHLKLKDNKTGEIYYSPTDIEVYGGVLSLTRTPSEIAKLYKKIYKDLGYKIVGEVQM